MLNSQKTLKILIEEFNSLLEQNFKKEIGRTDVILGKSGKTKNFLKNKYEIKYTSIEDFINSEDLVLIEKNIDNVFTSFLMKETECKNNFNIHSSTLGVSEYRNAIMCYIIDFNEDLYNFKVSDFNKFKRKIVIKYKQKNITVRDTVYSSSTETIKCMVGVELHNDSKIYENLTLEQILKTFIEEDRQTLEYRKQEFENKNNMIIENRNKFENKLKELNITEEDFNYLVSLSKK